MFVPHGPPSSRAFQNYLLQKINIMMHGNYCCRTREKGRNDADGCRRSDSQATHSRSSSSFSQPTTPIAEQQWNTIVEARVTDCCNWPDQALLPLLTEFGVQSSSQIRDFLWRHIEILSNSQEKAVERRKSYRKVKSLLERIDQAKRETPSAAMSVYLLIRARCTVSYIACKATVRSGAPLLELS